MCVLAISEMHSVILSVHLPLFSFDDGFRKFKFRLKFLRPAFVNVACSINSDLQAVESV